MAEIVIPYKPRELQALLHDRLERFNVLVCHRRFGKTVFAINEMIRLALTVDKDRPRAAYMCPLFKQAKQVAWDMVKHYSRVIPGVIFNESELRADYPNGGRLQLFGADNADALRGIYLDGVVLDEYAQMSPRAWSEVLRPALSDRKGMAIFIGTPQGHNSFHDLYEQADRLSGWHRELYKASETQLLDDDELKAMQAEMSDDEYAQELECSWTAAIKGAFWAKELTEIEDQIKTVPYDQNLPVTTACDLGIADSFSIWYIQELAGEIRVIDYDEYTGMGLPDIIRKMDEKGYKYKQHIAPFDIHVRELGSGTSRLETARKLGVNYTMAPKMPVQDGINAVRTSIPRMYFDKDKCKDGLEALRQYRTEYNDKRGIFSNAPLHDWCSHAADAMRYFCITKRKSSMSGKPIDYSQMDRAIQR
jgi:hypothetical protein